MLKLFKKQNVIISTITKNNKEDLITSKTIQADLHKSFTDVLKEFDLKPSKETEVEKLTNKLENFKKENQVIIDKVSKLKELNFVNTPSITKTLKELKDKEEEINQAIMSILNQIKASEKLQKLIREYSLKYPTYKFIDDKTMLNIMTKYDLYLGDAFIYSKEIPDENLSIISSFSAEIKESEETYYLVEKGDMSFRYYTIERSVMREKNTSEGYKGIWIQDPSNYRQILQSFKVSKLKIIAPQSHFSPPTFKHYVAWNGGKDVPVMKIDKESRKFVFSTDRLNELEAEKRKILDPIACLEVEGGYIILTAWDEEANIPEIRNTFLN